MPHQNSVFHQVQQHIPWQVFDRLVDEHKADHRVQLKGRLEDGSDLVVGLLVADRKGRQPSDHHHG